MWRVMENRTTRRSVFDLLVIAAVTVVARRVAADLFTKGAHSAAYRTAIYGTSTTDGDPGATYTFTRYRK